MDTIRRLRELKGWSLDDLARESGLSFSTVWRLETGKNQPSPATARRLAKALGVRFDRFLVELFPEEEPVA